MKIKASQNGDIITVVLDNQSLDGGIQVPNSQELLLDPSAYMWNGTSVIKKNYITIESTDFYVNNGMLNCNINTQFNLVLKSFNGDSSPNSFTGGIELFIDKINLGQTFPQITPILNVSVSMSNGIGSYQYSITSAGMYGVRCFCNGFYNKGLQVDFK